MWISKQMKPAAATADADLGVTTISGRKAGVLTRGEVRDLPVYGPGGVSPDPGQRDGGAGHQGRSRRRGAVRGRDPAPGGSKAD